MTFDEAKAEMGAAWATFDSQTRDLENGYTPEQMRAFHADEAAAQASEAAEEQRIEREERRRASLKALADSLNAAAASSQSAADGYGRAAQSIEPPPTLPAPPPVSYEHGYSQKPPPNIVCAGQVMISGPPDQASQCAGGQ
jgi:hypothetical protein